MLELPPPPVVVTAIPVEARVACNGETITRIDVYRYAPSRRNARTRASADSLPRGQRLNTNTDVVRAYLRLREGSPCREQDRADSERMLRAQRFVASAAVTPVADGPGRVRIRVDVVNEFELVLGGDVRGTSINEIRVGTLDWRGNATTLVGSLERGGAYRPGVGVLWAQPGALGRPAVLTLSAAQRPTGEAAAASLVQPFIADGQRQALLAHVESDMQYARLLRGDLPTAATRVHEAHYQLGVLWRVGASRRRRVVGLAGLVLAGERTTTSGSVVTLSDTGFAETGDATLVSRYDTYRSNHVAGVAALRALEFSKVERFDALRAEQDIANGFELTLLAGPSVGNERVDRDQILGIGLYAGRGDASQFATMRLRFEGRSLGGLNDGNWQETVSSARFTVYQLPDERTTRQISLGGAVLLGQQKPLQLSMGDYDGGLIGYARSTVPGGRRVTARLEQRRLVTSDRAWADVALGWFVDAGRLWRGDVPYGETTGLLVSTGVSLMTAYPSGGKRVYRFDLGVPLRRGPGDGAFVLRVTARDRTAERTPEPRDLTRARTQSGPTTLLRW